MGGKPIDNRRESDGYRFANPSYTGTRTVARNPPERALAERDVAAMRARDVARDRESKPGAALVLIARVVEPKERLEHILAHAGGMPGPSSSTVTVSQR